MRKLFLLWAGIFLLGYTLFAQNKTITGTVSDEKGIPLPNVSVVVKNSNIGTTTDFNGKFKIDVPASAKTLVFSSEVSRIRRSPLEIKQTSPLPFPKKVIPSPK